MPDRPKPRQQVYAVVRLEDPPSGGESCVTVKEIVQSLELAQAEVGRLNALNAGKGCRYFWQMTRLYPAGTCAGTDGAEDPSSAPGRPAESPQ